MSAIANAPRTNRRGFLAALAVLAASLGGAGSALLGVCGPFGDVSDPAFCPFVLEIFTLGITTGTTPTTYDPAGNVSRLQMSAFLSRTVDGVLRRGSRRALVKKFWTPVSAIPSFPFGSCSDGFNFWITLAGPGLLLRF